MNDSTDRNPASRLVDAGMHGAARAAHIRNWLDERKGRRKAFTPDEAVTIASRLDRALADLKTGEETGPGISRNQVALDAFGDESRDGDAERARRKLQRYVWTGARPNSTRAGRQDAPARAADGYARIVRTLNKKRSRDSDDDRYFLEIFEGTSADPLATGRPIDGEFAARLEARVQALADRLAVRLQLSHYYREVSTYGPLRDLGHPEVRFRRDARQSDPTGDLIEATLPHVNPAWFEAGFGMGGPSLLFSGRLPTTVLYRLRGAGPTPVEVRMHEKYETPAGVMDAIETRPGYLSYWWEIAIGAGPSDEWASGTRLFFETVPCAMIELVPEDRPRTGANGETAAALRPTKLHLYDLDELLFPPCSVYHGNRLVDARLVDPGTGDDIAAVDEALREEFGKNHWGLDPEHARYEPVTAQSWYQFLVTLPLHAEEADDQKTEAIVYESAQPLGTDQPQTLAVSPPETPGAPLEQELFHGATHGLEARLQANGEQLWAALDALRRESIVPDTGPGSDEPSGASRTAIERADDQLALDMHTWREQLGLTQREAAAWLDVTERTVNEYERDPRKMPHRVRLAMLFCALHPHEAEIIAQRRQHDDAPDP